MFQIRFKLKAKKELEKLEKRVKEGALEILLDLRVSPYMGKKLHGKFKKNRAIRIGRYRIVYRIVRKELIIIVVRIQDRKDVYR